MLGSVIAIICLHGYFIVTAFNSLYNLIICAAALFLLPSPYPVVLKKLLLILKNNDNYINLRPDYDFYFISDIEYKKEDERIIFTDYDFYINNKKYFVYILTLKQWEEGYNGDYNFKKGEDFNRGFILISDKLVKGF